MRLVQLFSSALCVLGWCGSVALYFGVVAPEHARAETALSSARANAEHARADLAANNERANRREAELNARIAELERAPSEVQIPVTPSRLGDKRKHPPRTRPMPEPHGPCGDASDPLNPCLKP
ncbi:MAG TPA: hypothetical protein VGI70_16720 [Polyangiales bacterium]